MGKIKYISTASLYGRVLPWTTVYPEGAIWAAGSHSSKLSDEQSQETLLLQSYIFIAALAVRWQLAKSILPVASKTNGNKVLAFIYRKVCAILVE